MHSRILLAIVIVAVVLFMVSYFVYGQSRSTMPSINTEVDNVYVGIPPTYIGRGQIGIVSYSHETASWNPQIVNIVDNPLTPMAIIYQTGGGSPSSGPTQVGSVYGVGQNLSSSALYDQYINSKQYPQVSCTASTGMAWSLINNTPFKLTMDWSFYTSPGAKPSNPLGSGAVNVRPFGYTNWNKYTIQDSGLLVPIYYGQPITFTTRSDKVQSITVSCPDNCNYLINPMVDILVITVRQDKGILKANMDVYDNAVQTVYSVIDTYIPTRMQLETMFPSIYNFGAITTYDQSSSQPITLSKFINQAGNSVNIDPNLIVPWSFTYSISENIAPNDTPVVALISTFQDDNNNPVNVVLAVSGGICTNPTFCGTYLYPCSIEIGQGGNFYGTYRCNPMCGSSVPALQNSTSTTYNSASQCSKPCTGGLNSHTINWLASSAQMFQAVTPDVFTFSASNLKKMPGFSAAFGSAAAAHPDTPLPLFLGQRFSIVQYDASKGLNGVVIGSANSVPLNINNFGGFLKIGVTLQPGNPNILTVDPFGIYVPKEPTGSLPLLIPQRRFASIRYFLVGSINLPPPNRNEFFNETTNCGGTTGGSLSYCSGSYNCGKAINLSIMKRSPDASNPDKNYNQVVVQNTDLVDGSFAIELQPAIVNGTAYLELLATIENYNWYGKSKSGSWPIPFKFGNDFILYMLNLIDQRSLSFLAGIKNPDNIDNLRPQGNDDELYVTLNVTAQKSAYNVMGIGPNLFQASQTDGNDLCNTCCGVADTCGLDHCNSYFELGYIRDIVLILTVSLSTKSRGGQPPTEGNYAYCAGTYSTSPTKSCPFIVNTCT